MSIIKLTLGLALLAWAGLAQTGSISGKVKNQAGNTLANATVTLENLSTGVKQSATTDANGSYRFDNLPGGTYRLQMSTAQFTGTPSEDISLDPNRPKTVDITVQSTGAPTTVAPIQVSEATELESATPRILVTYSTREIQYQPAANFMGKDGSLYGAYNLSMFSSGVTSSSGLTPSRGPVVGGQDPSRNNYYFDGVDNNNRLIPGPLVYIPNEVTTEFETAQNQFPAELGGHATGGQFNAITRTGTNQFHGALYDYLENRNLNANDQRAGLEGIANSAGFDENRLGGNFGFPIVPNKLFFYGGFEYIPLRFSGQPWNPVFAPTAAGYQTLAGLRGVSSANLGVLQNYVGAAPTQSTSVNVAGAQIPVGLLPITARQSLYQYDGVGSIDFTPSNSDQFRLRYGINDMLGNNNGAVLPAFFSPLHLRTMLASVAWYHNFSSGTVNELRLGYNRDDTKIGANSSAFPGLGYFPNISIADLGLQLGSGVLAAVPAGLETFQLSDNVTITRGRHTIKVGADARRFIGPFVFPAFANGVYGYSSLSSFLQDLTPNVTAVRSFGTTSYAADNFDTYAYANDSFRVSPSFTLNLGVKYEYVTLPQAFNYQSFNSAYSAQGLINFRSPQSQYLNFAPIVGIAWSPGFLRQTVFRAGFGMNYDTTYTAMNVPAVVPGLASASTSALGGFLSSGGITRSATGAAGINTYFPDQVLPYTMQWNAGLQKQILQRMVLDIRYLGVKSVHLPVQSLLNGTSPVTASNSLPVFYTQPSQAQLNALSTSLTSLSSATLNPAYTAAGFTSPISAVEPWGWSWYNGLAVSARQRFSGGLQADLNYTWSHLIDNMSGPTIGPAGISLLSTRITAGNSIYDHRQRATATLLWDISAIGKSRFNWLRDILANMTLGGSFVYETPATLQLGSGINTDLTGFGFGGVILNPNGVAGTGSGLSPLTNNRGQVVGYLVNNPSAQYIAGAPGVYAPLGHGIQFSPVNNFNATLYKRFALRDRFALEFHAEAFNVINHAQFTPAQAYTIASTPFLSTLNFVNPSSPAFDNPGMAFGNNPRTVQVGARLTF